MRPALQGRRGAIIAMAASTAVLVGASACSSDAKEVGAVEDLMREHGVIRRIVLLFRNFSTDLQAGHRIDPQILQRAATLFRNFGEDYHERKLEEEHIFPALVKAGGPGAAYVDVLKAQHDRGRQITDYILAATGNGTITADAGQLSAALGGLELMYEHHAAREDTIVFPAWKAALSGHQLEEMGEKFEDIEKKQFGKDGFEDAVKQIADIEQVAGLADIAQFTPPSPAQ
jgi:hemerythrin-like domain-containing protein